MEMIKLLQLIFIICIGFLFVKLIVTQTPNGNIEFNGKSYTGKEINNNMAAFYKDNKQKLEQTIKEVQHEISK